MEQIRDVLASLGHRLIDFLEQAGLGSVLPVGLPAAHFWFSGSAIYTSASFVLFAILGFVGIANMAKTYRKLMYFSYAAAFVLFLLGWWQSASQERTSANQASAATVLQAQVTSITESNRKQEVQLETVANQNSTLQATLSKIANAANLNPNQSADQIANAVIAKLEPLEKQVEALSARPPDELYQNGIDVGRVAGIMVDRSNGTVSFQQFSSSRDIDFDKEIELQHARLRCPESQSHGYSVSGAMRTTNYGPMTCTILGRRQ